MIVTDVADTGAVIFAIDVLWTCGKPILATVEQAFASSFRPLDEEACVWVDEQDSAALRVAFDVNADDYEPAIQEALREVRLGASKSGLPGSATRVTAMTDEGQAHWSA